MDKFLSIITPIYNSEKTIERTIDSVLGQTYTNFEYIIVDDGSGDSSLKICQEFASRDPRVKIYTQQNKGPSAARNLALDKAKGDYVAFIDADDWVVPKAYELMIGEAINSGADVVECGYSIEASGKLTKAKEFYGGDYLLAGGDLREYALNLIYTRVGERIKPYVWLRLIKRKTIGESGLRFNENVRRSEDYLFLSKLYIRAKGLKLIKDKKLYAYVRNEDSITQNYVNDYWNMVLNIYEDLKDDARELNDTEYSKRVDKALVFRTQVALYNESQATDGPIKRLGRIRQILSNPILKDIVRKMEVKEGIKDFGNSFVIIKYRLALLALLLKEN